MYNYNRKGRENMKIKILMEEKDYIKFNEYHSENSKQGKRNILSLRILLPAILLIAVLLLLGVHADLAAIIITAAVSLIASVLWICLTPMIMRNSIKKSVYRLKKDGKLPYTEKSELEFTENEIIETTDNSTMRVKYNEIESVGYSNEYIFIYYDTIHAFVIPKRCVGSDVDLESFFKTKTQK